MTSEDFKVLLDPCPRCGMKHEVLAYKFAIPETGTVNDGEATHHAKCPRNEEFPILLRIEKGEVIKIG